MSAVGVNGETTLSRWHLESTREYNLRPTSERNNMLHIREPFNSICPGRHVLTLDVTTTAVRANELYTCIYSNKIITLTFMGRYKTLISTFWSAVIGDTESFVIVYARGLR